MQFTPNGFEALPPLTFLVLVLLRKEQEKRQDPPGQIFRPKALAKGATLRTAPPPSYPSNLHCAVAFWFYFYRREISRKNLKPSGVFIFYRTVFRSPERERERERKGGNSHYPTFIPGFLGVVLLCGPRDPPQFSESEKPLMGRRTQAAFPPRRGVLQLTSSSVPFCD